MPLKARPGEKRKHRGGVCMSAPTLWARLGHTHDRSHVFYVRGLEAVPTIVAFKLNFSSEHNINEVNVN